MKTISLINLKGGVGKTTIATNLACLASQSWGVDVLFIDNDKQGNASRWLGADEEKGTLADILLHGARAKDVIQSSRFPHLDFIAADMSLLEANYAVMKDDNVRQDTILKNALAEVAEDYAICVIDNPPDINMSVFNALALTDDVIIVTILEADSIDGIRKMVQQIEDVRHFNPALSVKGVLANQFIPYPGTTDFLKEVAEEGLPIFKTKIPYATRTAKYGLVTASKTGKSIFEVCPNSRVARDMMRFAEELFQ